MNSYYGTINDADIYMQGRMESASWDTVSESKKQRSLISATRLIDNLNFVGQKYDSTQELEFPRQDNIIPQQIKNACYEVAYALLDGRDTEFDAETEFMSAFGMEGAKGNSDVSNVNIAKNHQIPSSVAWGFLRPYLRDGSEITLNRV